MSNPYAGEIRMFGGSFAPLGWLFCNGALLPIAQYEVLYTLIGTTYGGDGVNTFALPDLRSRVPMHWGSLAGTTYQMGETGGQEQVQLTLGNLPIHTHVPNAVAAATTTDPTNATWAGSSSNPYGASSGTRTTMSASAVLPAGGSEPYVNVAPFLAVSFIIATEGVFPTMN